MSFKEGVTLGSSSFGGVGFSEPQDTHIPGQEGFCNRLYRDRVIFHPPQIGLVLMLCLGPSESGFICFPRHGIYRSIVRLLTVLSGRACSVVGFYALWLRTATPVCSIFRFRFTSSIEAVKLFPRWISVLRRAARVALVENIVQILLTAHRDRYHS